MFKLALLNCGGKSLKFVLKCYGRFISMHDSSLPPPVVIAGQVSDLKGHFVTQVAMGKAHTCVLTKSGEVWTFGVNNKGQCGRDTGTMNQAGKGENYLSSANTHFDQVFEYQINKISSKYIFIFIKLLISLLIKIIK